jgi:hypothetical protein
MDQGQQLVFTAELQQNARQTPDMTRACSTQHLMHMVHVCTRNLVTCASCINAHTYMHADATLQYIATLTAHALTSQRMQAQADR